MSIEIEYKVSPPVTNAELNALFAYASPRPNEDRDYGPVLRQSLAYICGYRHGELVAFVNVAWDAGLHTFLLDPTVRSDLRRQGIGQELVRLAVEVARAAGAEWLHVDYESRLAEFYSKCGFRHTEAGLINLRRDEHRTIASTRPREPGG